MRRDPISGRTVVIAPGRARRPGAFDRPPDPPTQGELEECPFCAGREDRTPPETLALPNRQSPDTPGWCVRVVPNLYPAFERHEVVIHSPRHVRSFAELQDAEITFITRAWQLRARAAREHGFPYVHALVNEGRAAGASLTHSHSQLVWMREPPPAVTSEGDAVSRTFELLKSIHGRRDAAEHDVDLDQDVLLVCPPAGRVPYEMLITNGYLVEPDAFESDGLERGLRLLRSAIRRLRAVEGPVPWNAWLHNGPSWHIEILPRLTVFAGVELGAGIYVNTLPPDEAAARLRSV